MPRNDVFTFINLFPRVSARQCGVGVMMLKDDPYAMNSRERPPVFKVITVGPSGAGKTSILAQFAKGTPFDERMPATIGADFYVKDWRVGGRAYRTQLWDTAGQEKFQAIVDRYYRDTHAVVVVIDLVYLIERSEELAAQHDSLDAAIDAAVAEELSSLDRALLGERTRITVRALMARPLVLVFGNKIDLLTDRGLHVDEVPVRAALKRIAETRYDATYVDTSVKSKVGACAALTALLDRIVDLHRESVLAPSSSAAAATTPGRSPSAMLFARASSPALPRQPAPTIYDDIAAERDTLAVSLTPRLELRNSHECIC